MATPQSAAWARSRLPWILGLIALGLYGFTLNRWISVSNLDAISRMTDPSGTVPLITPLFYLITRLFLWLPQSVQIPALNALSALCAAGVIALLARSVALLPHDRTREERHRESDEHSLLSLNSAWVPPLVAALVCGLQLSFWEHATAASGEMLDLLCFAYIVRCLLEHRIDGRDGWLFRMAFVYGLATTNNWAMIGFFPLCLTAVIWIKGREYFRAPLLLGLFLCGLSGLLLYLVLPILTALDPKSTIGFWQALRLELVTQKGLLFFVPRWITLIAAVTSLFPLLLMGVRWPSTSGDTSVLGSLLTRYVFRVVYGLLLVAGLLVALDLDAPFPAFSPRLLVEHQFGHVSESGLSLPFLTLYYLGALAIGYYVGYFQLLFARGEDHGRRRSPGSQPWRPAATAIVWALCGLAVAVLAVRNLPAIQANNGRLFRDFADRAAAALPPHPAIVIGDETPMLAVLQLGLQAKGAVTNHLLVASRFLEYAAYQLALHQRAPHLWPSQEDSTNIQRSFSKAFLMYELSELLHTRDMYYLQPSFGYFFEPMHQQPNGLLYRLRNYQTNEIGPPLLSPGQLQTNRAFWAGVQPGLDRLIPLVSRRYADARVVGRWYSLALNRWGVELQRLPEPPLAEAGRCFEAALRLNPDNVAAEINRDYNLAWQSGKVPTGTATEPAERRFGSKFRGWSDVLRIGGPIDDPRYCLELGRILADQSLDRQAALQLRRTLELDPGNLAARIGLAQIFVSLKLSDLALETLAPARSGPTPSPDLRVSLIQLEALALQGKGQGSQAETLLLHALQQYPNARSLIESLIEVYLTANQPRKALDFIQDQVNRRPDPDLLLAKALVCRRINEYTEANQALDQILARHPHHAQALLTKGVVAIQSGQFTNALPPLDTLLRLEPEHHAARLNRAIARLQAGQLAAAQEDYEALLKVLPGSFPVRFGLGEIAWKQKHTAQAIEHFEAYLQFAPPDTEEAKGVRARLDSLRAERPRK